MEAEILTIVIVSILPTITILPALTLQQIFVKSGRAGWKAWIPVYNIISLCDVVGRVRLWGYFLLVAPGIPVVGYYIAMVVWAVLAVNLGRVFGKGRLFRTVLVFFPIIGLTSLALGNAAYQVPPDPYAPVVHDESDDAAENSL